MSIENSFDFSQEQFEKELKRFYNSYKSGKHPVDAPTAHLLGGQAGSGKSTIHKILVKQDPNTIVIDGDRFRERHPFFKEIQQKYGREAANYTQPFSNKITEALIERFSNEKFNLIIEGTCRTISVPLKTCEQLKNKGYTVNLAIMCTNKDVAWQSTIERYNAMEERGLLPRAVPRDKYDEMVAALPDNISKLHNSKKFDDILLFNRNRECLYCFKEQPNRDPAEIVRSELNGQPVLSVAAGHLSSPKSLSEKIEDAKKAAREKNAARSQHLKPTDHTQHRK